MRRNQDFPQWSILGLALFAVSLGALVRPSVAFAEEESDGFRSRLEKWVEVRTILSKERSDWLGERQYLESTRDLLKDERAALREEIESLEASQTGADEERRDLVLERGEYQRTSESLAIRIQDLERQVLSLVPRLPQPLTDRLEPLLVQIPDDLDESKAALGQRLMNVLGVLAQSEKWNSTATLVGETRAVGVAPGSTEGQKVQVRTLYWGLGQAVYVDNQGEIAGIGRPAETGWSFEDDPALAADAKLLLDIYEGNVDTIAFVPIPVQIQ